MSIGRHTYWPKVFQKLSTSKFFENLWESAPQFCPCFCACNELDAKTDYTHKECKKNVCSNVWNDQLTCNLHNKNISAFALVHLFNSFFKKKKNVWVCVSLSLSSFTEHKHYYLTHEFIDLIQQNNRNNFMPFINLSTRSAVTRIKNVIQFWQCS